MPRQRRLTGKRGTPCLATGMGSYPNAYDHDMGAHISASPSGLYHHGLGAHISLSVNGSSFSGYDYGEGHHFSGTVNGSSVQLYDYGEGRHFNYQA
jgi:hypothetical protein